MRLRFCAHPAESRSEARGVTTCGNCGVRRFGDYAALLWDEPPPPPVAAPTTRTRGLLLLQRA